MTESYERWCEMVLEDPDLAAELAAIADDPTEIADRFGRELEFGTGGLRGVLGAGPNRMNIYTVRKTTQGMCNHLNRHRGAEAPAVAISYDSRNKSRLFAEEAARVLAGNGIVAHLYEELMPTPALSFAVRELGCQAGIMITASHNPAKYNGYKAYGSDGCQMVSQVADAVWDEIQALGSFEGIRLVSLGEGRAQNLIRPIPQELVERYLAQVLAQRIHPGICGDLRVVYTPLNGAGNRCVRTVLGRMGVASVMVVPEQEHPDGNFPTCPYPNPEIKEAMALGLALAKETGADLLLATDPDCDRVGIAVPNGVSGEYIMLTGNEVGVLLVDYIASQRIATGTMPKDPMVVKSIVTTAMTVPVAQSYGVQVVDVLTGFKYIGEQIGLLEQAGQVERYLLGFEESYGYLTGSYVRDKDAVNGAAMIAEMAAFHLREGRTLPEALQGLYDRFGTYYNAIDNFAFEGVGGMDKMAAMMKRARENPPAALADSPVVALTDYAASVCLREGREEKVNLPTSNVLSYELANGAVVIIRPSGTEPKLKAYYSVKGDCPESCRALWQRLAGDVKRLLGM